jgi:DNA-binding NtrC family response regulator
MPLELQAKLLRALEDGNIMPIGATVPRPIDVRIVAPTNAQLQQRIAQGGFREDLYYRLAGFVIKVPPLRERQEDIPLLANHFLEMFAKEMGREETALSNAAKEALMAYHFPGNIRELKNIIESALIKSRGATIQPEHLNVAPPQDDMQLTTAPIEKIPQNNEELIEALTFVRREAAKPLVHKTLAQWFSQTSKMTDIAAQRGIGRTRLYELAREHDVDLNQLRK